MKSRLDIILLKLSSNFSLTQLKYYFQMQFFNVYSKFSDKPLFIYTLVKKSSSMSSFLFISLPFVIVLMRFSLGIKLIVMSQMTLTH